MKTTSIRSTRVLFPQISGILRYTLLPLFIAITINTAQAGVISPTLNLNQPAGKLPLYINELQISALGQNLVISWQADKTNFEYYEVEKSLDGKLFTTIGLVMDAPENSNICLFKDKKANNSNENTVWYRIKAIDKTGGLFFSNSIAYEIKNEPLKAAIVTAFPNPFTNATAIQFMSDAPGFAEVKVQNLEGQILLSKQSNINKGHNSIALEGLGRLNNGIYMARLSVNGTIIGNQKIIKK